MTESRKSSNSHIDGILKNLPTTSGIYQMKDSKGDVMYVGKAKNLKSRVGSYFARTGDLNLAKRQMVGKIGDIEVTLTSSEVEALVLETNLIKHLRPKYNILMKDDKNLSYIKITRSPIPEAVKTRIKIRDGGEYFGPYVGGAEQSLRTLKRLLKIRNCRMKFEKRADGIVITDKAGRTIPCMDYYIGLCPAPCTLEDTKIEEHTNHLDKLRLFLRGESLGIFSELEEKMQLHAKNLEFEEAQKIKYSIESLRYIHERQKVRDLPGGDMDVVVQYEKYNRHFIGLTQVRGGQIIGVFRHELTTKLEETTEDMLLEFLALQYVSEGGIISDEGSGLPEALILTEMIEDDTFVEFLGSNKITIEIPKAGAKQELLAFTLNQLREYAYKSELATLEQKLHTREHMANILERLGYEVPKKGEIVFECYDISHTHGQFTVASRAVIVNGKPDPSRYRKYNIKSLPYEGKIDDFASHREVMKRRTIESLEVEGGKLNIERADGEAAVKSSIHRTQFPHLIIIDGGKGQLSSALAGIEDGIRIQKEKYVAENTISEQNSILFSTPQICSIAKREEEIFIPREKKPVIFEKGTPELMVLQKARDESHRFAITANRSARTKAMKKNILEELPGFGPVTRKKLLKLAGSIDEIKNLPNEELQKICTKAQVETLRDHGLI